MSTTAAMVLLWGDGEYRFRLGIKEIRELQEKTGVGPHALLRRVVAGDWRVDDLRETIRVGLIGGGLEPTKAMVAVLRYVDDRPLLESVEPVVQILNGVLAGWASDPVGKEKPARKGRKATASTSPASTAAAP